MRSMGLVLAICVAVGAAGGAQAQPDLVRRGHKILADLCSQCHAVDKTGRSPHAGAPAFREIDLRVDLDQFIEQLHKGLHSSYEKMPSVRFTRDEANAIVAYLRFIQAP